MEEEIIDGFLAQFDSPQTRRTYLVALKKYRKLLSDKDLMRISSDELNVLVRKYNDTYSPSPQTYNVFISTLR